MDKKLKAIGIMTICINLVYLAWFTFNIQSPLAVPLLLAEYSITAMSLLFFVNHWNQLHLRDSKMKAFGKLDVFIPVVNEPFDMVEATIKAATNIIYENKVIYLLDDSGNHEYKSLANEYKCQYLHRSINTDYKAGNLNYGLENSTGHFVLVLDADQIVDPTIAEDLLGYFREDEKLAMITTRQSFEIPKNDFNNDILFYEHMQPGKNIDNAAISCGSGVIYKRTALAKIGGFQTWNIVEDLFTSYTLHRSGYKSLYVNKAYTKGTAPLDLKTIFKQRGTWAYDTMRLFLYHCPFVVPALSFKQRLHYIEIAMAYLISAIALPIIFIFPAITLITGLPIISHPLIYLFLRIPSLLLTVYFYYQISGKTFSTSQFWASLSFLYLISLIKALNYNKTNYQVTEKRPAKESAYKLIIPHLVLISFNLGAVMWRLELDHHFDLFIATNLVWIILMIFWFWPVLQKAIILYKIKEQPSGVLI